MVMDPRRRRPDEEQASGGGIAGPNITPGMMMPYFQGTPNYDFSGIQGQGGLAAFLQAMQQNPGRGMGPAGRHLRNVGQPVDFPGQDTQMDIGAPGAPIGGPNVAPGNPQGLAIGQSGMLPPGLERQQAGLQNTQGWRNLAPGYAIAAGAGFGTKQFNEFMGGDEPGAPTGKAGGSPTISKDTGRPAGAPGATADAPGPQQLGGGGPAQGSGGPPGGGGKGGGKAPAGVTPRVKQQAATQQFGEGGSQGARGGINPIDKKGGISSKDFITAASIPNKGNNNTPSETRPPRPPSAAAPPPASSFGKDKRGTGTAPIGKKKSASGGGGKPTRGGLAARRA